MDKAAPARSADRRAAPRKRPQLVESGSFRLDPRKAFEKLRDFQTADPDMFVLPLVRAAVASAATRIDLRLPGPMSETFEMRFDGAPLDPAAADPAVCLFAPAAAPAVRQAAVGMLAAFRVHPEILLCSGAGSERRSLAITPLGTRAGALLEEEEETVLSVALSRPLPGDWTPRVAAACAYCPCKISVNGEALEGFSRRGGLEVKERGRRIWVQPAHRDAPVILLCHWGVVAGRWSRRQSPRVAGFADDPALALSMSQDSVVKNAALEAAREAVDRAARRLAAGWRKGPREAKPARRPRRG